MTTKDCYIEFSTINQAIILVVAEEVKKGK